MSKEAATLDTARATSPGLLTQIEIRRGPRDLLGRFFLFADKVLSERGIFVETATLEDLLRINELNRDSWLPLTPTFHPTNSQLDTGHYFCFFGRNAAGDVVTVQAARLFDWRHTNFRSEAEALRLFYQNPDRDRRASETLQVTAPSAEAIRGLVAYTGAMWYRPDCRGLGLGYYMGRISRAYALAQWDISFVASMVSSSNVNNGFARRFGHANLEFGAHSRASSHGDVDYHIAWSDSAQAMTGLAEFLASEQGSAPVDRGTQVAAGRPLLD